MKDLPVLQKQININYPGETNKTNKKKNGLGLETLEKRAEKVKIMAKSMIVELKTKDSIE